MRDDIGEAVETPDGADDDEKSMVVVQIVCISCADVCSNMSRASSKMVR